MGKAKIQMQMAREIPGVGLVLQFLILEGVLKPGMKTEFKGGIFTIKNRMFAIPDEREAEKSLFLQSGVRYRELSEAKPEDGIIQAACTATVERPIQFLIKNKEGLLVFSD
jgi:hypothetical protein